MKNFGGGFVGKVFASYYKLIVQSRPLQLIAATDIGVSAAKALIKPVSFSGKAISLAGDELTYEQMAAVFKEKTGWGTMFEFLEREGYDGNIEELRKMRPEMKTLGTWLERLS
ncbi:hypothetical protein diail_10304, partial [Diaporthe ilicicola]